MREREELISIIHADDAPDKNRILRVQKLASDLASGLTGNVEVTQRFSRAMSNAYLRLQLALIADDRSLVETARRSCMAFVRMTEKPGNLTGRPEGSAIPNSSVSDHRPAAPGQAGGGIPGE